MFFFILFFLLPVHAYLGGRRLENICEAQAFILAEGAPTLKRGKTFSMEWGYVDARIDISGRGTALLQKVDPCLLAGVIPLKVMDGMLKEAVEYITEKCASRACIVYTAYPKVTGNFKVV